MHRRILYISSRIHRMRLTSLVKKEEELNLVGSNSDEVSVEIEYYCGSANCPITRDNGGYMPVEDSDEGGMAATGAEFATTTPSEGSTDGMWVDWVVVFTL